LAEVEIKTNNLFDTQKRNKLERLSPNKIFARKDSAYLSGVPFSAPHSMGMLLLSCPCLIFVSKDGAIVE